MSVQLAPSLIDVGGSHSGVAPVNLIDIQDTNGNQFYFADRTISVAPAIPLPGGPGPQLVPIIPEPNGNVVYRPWLLGVPNFTLHRSLMTDSGVFVFQNVSGNTLARDLDTQLRASALQGAFFIYRCWQAGAEASWMEVHGTLTLDPGASPDDAQIKGVQLFNPAQDATPLEIYSETCQLTWGLPRCGSTQPTECLYSFQSCQVVERPMLIANDFAKNYGDTTSNTPFQIINRSRIV